jgi:hypothetical protein
MRNKEEFFTEGANKRKENQICDYICITQTKQDLVL